MTQTAMKTYPSLLLRKKKKNIIKNMLTSDYTGELMNYYSTTVNPPKTFIDVKNHILHTLQTGCFCPKIKALFYSWNTTIY